jgi:hypothetical protein
MTATSLQLRSGPSRSAACHALSYTAEHLKTRSWEFEPRAIVIFRCPYVGEVTHWAGRALCDGIVLDLSGMNAVADLSVRKGAFHA